MSDFGFDPYHALPDDPEAAFLRLEAHFSEECEESLRIAERNNERTDVIHVHYMAQVLGAINALGLEGSFSREVPAIEDVDFNTYLNFNKDVMYYKTVLKVRRSQRESGYSVRFDDAAKTKLRHHLNQVQEIFDELEVEDLKRAKLVSRLSDLREEIEQPRTRYERYAALAVEVAGVVGDVVERTKIIELLDAVGRVFYGAQTEKQKQLPAPTQKRIEPPKADPPTPKVQPRKRADMDDDIPF